MRFFFLDINTEIQTGKGKRQVVWSIVLIAIASTHPPAKAELAQVHFTVPLYFYTYHFTSKSETKMQNESRQVLHLTHTQQKQIKFRKGQENLCFS